MNDQTVYANVKPRVTESEQKYFDAIEAKYPEKWRPIPSYPDFEISSVNGYIRVIETKEWVVTTDDGRGLRLVWFFNKKGKGVALKKVGDLWIEAFPDLFQKAQSKRR